MKHPRDFPATPATPLRSLIAWREGGLMSQLGDGFFEHVSAEPVEAPHWVGRSHALAKQLGLTDWMASDDALAVLSGTGLGPGQPPPLATAYSGHQFGVWAGALGDGRALLLGEIDTPLGPQELQLKGSGATPFSRRGDGRAVLRSSIREFLCSEAMAALGVPTTRALAVVGSPLPVFRETQETAAIVTRVAPSFLRFGHFEHHCHTTRDPARLRQLADAVIERFFGPLLEQTEPGVRPYRLWLQEVSRRTAQLIAQWQSLGFCHGVMNTDNMSILGLTLDYGPFGFMDGFNPGHICNHSDHQGRYAWGRQPQIAYWNLHALAMALRPLFDDPQEPGDAIEVFKSEFHTAWSHQLKSKLGLQSNGPDDEELARDWLGLMADHRTDFTLAFRALSSVRRDHPEVPAGLSDLFIDREALKAWVDRYRARLTLEQTDDAQRAVQMNQVNPRYVLRNHLAEVAIESARQGDFSEVQRLLGVLAHPYDEQPENASYAALPPSWAEDLEISCSS